MTMTAVDLEACKRAAAFKAVEYVKDGMVIGLGTGSTAKYMLLALGEKVNAGMRLRGVPTSEETAELAIRSGITLLETGEPWSIDIALDGADQVDPAFNLIKGGGGALLKEKIVAASAKQFIVIVDYSKQVSVLGGSFPLPVEIVQFGWGRTVRDIEDITQSRVTIRKRLGAPFKTEEGHLIADVHIARIEQPGELETNLNRIPGIVETGLFVGRTHLLIVGTPEGTATHIVSRT